MPYDRFQNRAPSALDVQDRIRLSRVGTQAVQAKRPFSSKFAGFQPPR